LSAGDITVMDAIGYDLVATPEPNTLVLIVSGFVAIGWHTRRSLSAQS